MARSKGGDDGGKGESVMGYFRKIFDQNPKLLKIRSNEELFNRWLADHPGETAVPEKVKNGLANLKSLLRKARSKRGPKPKDKAAQAAAPSNGSTVHIPASKLEGLEQQIDDCIALAKAIDRQELENVIRSLRRARNEIVVRFMKP
jgi:hypothetical protein